MNHSYTRLFHKKYWLLILVFFTSISFSWGQFGYTQPESNDCGANLSIADINVSLSGASYSWSSGPTTQNLSNVTNGYYTLTIDGSLVLPVIVGVPVEWKNLVNATDATDGRLQANTTTAWGNEAGANSIAKLASNQSGGFTFVVDNLSTLPNMMVGLSPLNASAAFTSIKNSFYVDANSRLQVYSDNGIQRPISDITVALNDRLTMVRSGSNILYYHNATLVYTDNTAVPSDELVVDMSIIGGTSPKIWFSVCTPSLNFVTYSQTQADDCATPAPEASIVLTPQDGTGPYTYSGSGVTNATPTSLSNGLVQVTVTDAFSSSTTVPVVVGNPVIWTDLSNTSQSQGKLFAINNSSINDGGAFSSAGLAIGTNGGITYTHNENFTSYMVGLSSTNLNAAWSSLQYSLFLFDGYVYIYESGSLVGTYPDLSNGDRLTIVREGSEIAYYRNNTLLKRSSVSSSVQLFADANVWSGETPVIYSSFCTSTTSTLSLSYTQTSFDDCSTGPGEGIVSLQGLGGTSAYSYTWNDASTSNPRSSLSKGLYTVTLQSGAASVPNSPVVVGGTVNWVTLSNATQGGGSLTATTVTDWNTPAGGFSSNVLASNTDGGITYLVSSSGQGNYQIGLSPAGATATTWESIGYGVWIGLQNSMIIYESGAQIGRFASVSSGDRISIIRRGSNIEYYLNSTLIRTSATTAAQDLFADISVIEGTSPAVYASFCASGPLLVSYTQTTEDVCGNGTGNGAITVNPSGGTGSYTYAWTGDNGVASTVTRTSLGVGLDELTVTSGSSITTPVISGTLVNWGNISAGATQLNGTLTSATNDAGYTGEPAESGALSTNELPANDDGGITYIIPSVVDADKYMIGLSPASATSPVWQSLAYSIYLTPGANPVIQVYEAGPLVASTPATAAAGDRITILRKGSNIEYYHNNTMIRSVATNPAQTLYADVTVISGTTPPVYASFCNSGVTTRVGDETAISNGTTSKKVAATTSTETATQTLFAYPNPSNGKVTVRLSDKEVKGTVSLRVIDVLGRVILTQNVEKQSSTLETSFDLKNQKAGIYFVEIASQNQTQRIKIVKE